MKSRSNPLSTGTAPQLPIDTPATPAPQTVENLILVTRTTRATGKAVTERFSTLAGAEDFLIYSLFDHTPMRLGMCRDAARLILGLGHSVYQTQFGPFFFTINKTGRYKQ